VTPRSKVLGAVAAAVAVLPQKHLRLAEAVAEAVAAEGERMRVAEVVEGAAVVVAAEVAVAAVVASRLVLPAQANP
jgi:hypothetical protein